MNLVKCYLTTSTWMKGTARNGRPVGILWHDTGAGNPRISRYVQPADNDPNREELLKVLGKNIYGNDWNHAPRQAGVNAFVGLLGDDKTVGTCLTSDFDVHPWGCASGPNGSLNGYTAKGVYIPEFYFQFEICDSGYGYDWYDKEADKEYFAAVYKEACELTAYICKEFNIDPLGYNDFCGQKVPTIVCHRDSWDYGLGNQHADIYVWFKKFGKDMNTVRADVKAILDAEEPKPEPEPEPTPELKLYDVVRLKPEAVKWSSGKGIAGWVHNFDLYVRRLYQDGRVTVSITREGDCTGTCYATDLVLVSPAEPQEPAKPDEPITPSPAPVVDPEDPCTDDEDPCADDEDPCAEDEPIPEPAPIPEPTPAPEPAPIPDPVEPDPEPVEPEPIPEPDPVDPDDKKESAFVRLLKAIVAVLKQLFGR